MAGVVIAVICLVGALEATAESDAVPKAPNVVLKQASSSTLLFTWEQVANAPAYDVYLGTTRIGMTTFPRADFRSLSCNTRYVVRVFAVTERGTRSVPDLVSGTTGACTPSPSPKPTEGSSKPPPGSRPPSPPPPPNPPPVGTPAPPGSGVYVALGGSDKNPCSAAQPCATFDRAYRAASPGQAVFVGAGSYASQTIRVDATKNGAGAAVVFLPAGGGVHVAGVSIYGSHVELRNLTTRWGVFPGANGVTLRNVIADGKIAIDGASNVSVLGGQVYSPVPVSSDPVITSLHGSVPTNILIDGVYFHDFIDVGPGQLHHIECLQVGGAINLTIQNSTFRNCSTHDIFIRSWGMINGDPHPLTNIVVQNNTLAATVAGFYSMQILDDLWTGSATSFVVQNNTAAQNFVVRITHGVAQVRNNNLAGGGGGVIGGGGSTSTPPHVTPVGTGTVRRGNG